MDRPHRQVGEEVAQLIGETQETPELVLVLWSGSLVDGAQPVLIWPNSSIGDIVAGEMNLAPDLKLIPAEDDAVGPTALEDMTNPTPQLHKGWGMDEDIIDELENLREASNSLITLAAPPITAEVEASGCHYVIGTPLWQQVSSQLLALRRKRDLVVAVQCVQLLPGVFPCALEDDVRRRERLNGPLDVRVDG